MNRRELLVAGASGIAGLLVPSVAVAATKKWTLYDYVMSLPQEKVPSGRSSIIFWLCYWDEKYGLPIKLRYVHFNNMGREFKEGLASRSPLWWVYTQEGPMRLDLPTLELLPFKPVVNSLDLCWMPRFRLTQTGKIEQVGIWAPDGIHSLNTPAA